MDREQLRVGGVHVTTATRTLADLSRVADEAHLRAAQLLAETDPALTAEAIAWLDDHRLLPHRHAGIAVLRRWAETGVAGGQEDVTR